VIAGQATIIDELLEQAPEITQLVVPVGGGGLIAGVLLALADHGRTDISVTGVQPENSAAMYHVLRGMTNAEVEHHDTIADGLAGGGDDGAATNEVLADTQTPLVLVPEPIIRAAVREVVEVNGLVLEGSAAIAYGAIAHGLIDERPGAIGFIASGRNITASVVRELLDEPRH
jgi:threonine dehydratase